MELLDPEMSASSGLTNDVCGRLSIFSAPAASPCKAAGTEESEQICSAQVTPSKDGAQSSEGEEENDVEEDENSMSEEERQMYKATDEYLEGMKGKSDQEIKMMIGERLYYIIHDTKPELAGKLTGMFLEAAHSVRDLALLLFSPPSLKLLLQEALKVLTAAQSEPHTETTEMPSPTSDKSSPRTERPAALREGSLQVPGIKRTHPPGSRQALPHSKKQRTDTSRPFFAEITDDSGRRTRVPCRYDAKSRMYVPSGGRDTVPSGKKVGTRDKTPQDLQALELGEQDEGKLRARQKQINIGCKTEGFRKLAGLGLSGRELQDAIGLPYITEQGTLALTLVCSKKRYDGYLRIWKRKLYEFAALRALRFSATAAAADSPPRPAPVAPAAVPDAAPEVEPAVEAAPPRAGTWAARVASSKVVRAL